MVCGKRCVKAVTSSSIFASIHGIALVPTDLEREISYSLV